VLNEEELAQGLRAMHAALLASRWHITQTPHPLELQPGQTDAVAVTSGSEASLLETALRVQAAAVIVAAHGGQCYNLVFAAPGAVFIEIVPGLLASDGPYTVLPFASGLGLEVWITLVPGVAHRSWESVRPFTAKVTNVVAIVLRSFSIPAVDIAQLELDATLVRRAALPPRSLAVGAVCAMPFVGRFLDQVVREHACTDAAAEHCLSVGVMVSGAVIARYAVSSLVGVIVNGEVAMELPPGFHAVQLVLMDEEGSTLGVSSGVVKIEAEQCVGVAEDRKK
jgi:hypothetical protein